MSRITLLCFDLVRTPAKTATAAFVVDPTNPNAIPVNISEKDTLKAYPWDYKTLTEKLKARYTDFKINSKYHGARKKIVANTQLMKTRYLAPDNPKSASKDYYSPNILDEFDRVYTRKKWLQTGWSQIRLAMGSTPFVFA